MGKKKSFKLRKLLPYAGPFLIFLGVLRLIIYYNAFGVKIVNFLDLTEIITSFLDIVVSTIMMLGAQVILTLFSETKEFSEYKDKIVEYAKKEPSFFKRLLLYFKAILWQVIVVFAFAVAGDWLWTFMDSDHEPTYIVSISFFIIFSLFVVLVYEIERRHAEAKSSARRRQFIFLTIMFLAFTVAVVLQGWTESRTLKRKNGYAEVVIELDQATTIYCNKNYYYIGKTNNYVFLYSEASRSTDVIKMDRVKKITFKNVPLF
jgi:hypothetical protein